MPDPLRSFVSHARIETDPGTPPAVFLFGVAAEEVALLEVRLDDGTTFEMPPLGGELEFPVNFFIHPARLVGVTGGEAAALSREGQVVERRRFLDPIATNDARRFRLRIVGQGQLDVGLWQLMAFCDRVTSLR